jgi:hypothetical protein
MKKFVFVLALTGSFYIAAGQTYHPFVDTGKVWSTYHNYCKQPGSAFSEFIRFDKDTLIDGQTYKIAWSTRDTNMASWTKSAFIREDAQKKVFLRYPYSDYETTIYNFGALAGDTIALRQFAGSDSSIYTVDSINWVIMLDGEQRQIFFLHCIWFPCDEIWIEGMGCTKGVFEGGTCGFVGDNPSLICFTQNDTLLYINPDYNKCYVITGIGDPAQPKAEISIYPNPVNEFLTIKMNKTGTLKMKFDLTDISGKEILSFPIIQNETSINLNHFGVNPGFYIYHVFQGTIPVKTGEIIILN